MDRLQPLLVHVRVNLGRGNVRVPQHFLDNSQIGALLSRWVAKLCRKQMGIDIRLQSGVFRAALSRFARSVSL